VIEFKNHPTPCGGGVKAVWQKCHTGKLVGRKLCDKNATQENYLYF